jgi:hypothetical protein
MKKYSIGLGVRSVGVQMIRLTEDEKNELMKEECLDDIIFDWVDKCNYEFEVEGYYLTPEVDRYSLIVTDEDDDEVVYESEDVTDLNDKTFDEESGESQVKGWKFEGVREGFYLTKISTIKGSSCMGELEIEEPFDENKLYVVQDTKLDDQLVGDCIYPIWDLYYQKGEGYDMERDSIGMDYQDDCGEQYWNTYLIEVKKSNFWVKLRGSELDED